MIALAIVTFVLSLIVLICVLALMDQYRTLELIRTHLGITDAPRPLDVRRDGAMPSAAGLSGHFDDTDHLVLLFLTTSCSTCKAVASPLHGRRESSLVVVLAAKTRDSAFAWVKDVGLDPSTVVVDLHEKVAAFYGIEASPSAIVLSYGKVVLAQTVPSFRQLSPLLSRESLPA